MKSFDEWGVEKKKLEEFGHAELAFHKRDIWWCSVGINLGDEQDGKNANFERPVLVLKKFNQKIAWVLPMSSKIKDGIYYHRLYHDGKTLVVILSQIRLISVKRIRRYMQKISQHQFKIIQNKIIDLIKSAG